MQKKTVVNAIILNENDELMIVTRASGRGKGLITIPGGKVEENETHEQALKREIKEETNLDIINSQYFDKVSYPDLNMNVYLFIVNAEGNIILKKDELESYKFVKISEIDYNRIYSPDIKEVKRIFSDLDFYIKSRNILKELTGKKHIIFTDRGNTSILLALKLCKSLNKKDILIQDQGGWLTYRDFPKKLKLNLSEIKTDYGIVDTEELKNNCNEDSAFLLNSFPGYFAEEENISEIQKTCNQNKTFLINDASGSIGTGSAKTGDVILGSFGRAKPINVEYGGFIATDNENYYDFLVNENKKQVIPFYDSLYEKLTGLNARRERLYLINKKIKSDLTDFEIVHKSKQGINVIVKFNNEQVKNRIIKYCNKNNYEYTLCPRYIRILDDAVSIEVKRL
ncbi:NUDIX domain-containing protein [Candidatus Woesearchaeota archaeon]|nr:NUDIX domain-containing protein [Candidatus Woesearchaeota archaeon]